MSASSNNASDLCDLLNWHASLWLRAPQTAKAELARVQRQLAPEITKLENQLARDRAILRGITSTHPAALEHAMADYRPAAGARGVSPPALTRMSSMGAVLQPAGQGQGGLGACTPGGGAGDGPSTSYASFGRAPTIPHPPAATPGAVSAPAPVPAPVMGQGMVGMSPAAAGAAPAPPPLAQQLSQVQQQQARRPTLLLPPVPAAGAMNQVPQGGGGAAGVRPGAGGGKRPHEGAAGDGGGGGQDAGGSKRPR